MSVTLPFERGSDRLHDGQGIQGYIEFATPYSCWFLFLHDEISIEKGIVDQLRLRLENKYIALEMRSMAFKHALAKFKRRIKIFKLLQ